MPRIAVFTLTTPDRIAHARVLLTGLARYNPDWERHVFLVDRPDGPRAFSDGLAVQRSIEELGVPDFAGRLVRYTLFETTNSLKPFGFRRLFAEGFEAVLYLDADIKVYSELREAEEALCRHALVLSPHLTEPLPQEHLLSEEATIRILHAGSFNGGFLAMRDTPEIRSFLDWWEGVLAYHCLPASCHDQAWLNYAPCFVSETAILRHPGYNLAYWNLPSRSLAWEGTGPPRCAGGRPLRFFHFSGFDWTKPDILSKWDRLCRGQDMPSAVSRLIEDYLGSLRSEEVERWSRVPSRLGLSGNYAIPDFLLDWLRRQPAFEAVARADWRDGDVEQALLEFFLLPDRTYPWLPIFLGRTLDSVPGLRETFPCESGFLVQDLATWFESVGRTALGFGSLFPSRGWWTEKTGVEMFLRQAEGTWGTRLQNWKIPPAFSTFAEDYLASLRSEAIERWRHTDARLWLSPRYAIPDFLRDWLLQQPSFEAAARADWQGGDIEQALLEFFLLPDRTYPWLPIFLGRTLDSVPGLRETFPCESGFLVQDLATWFESVGRMALGFGSLFPSRSWWTEERGLEKHLRRVVERWLRSKKSVVSRKTRFRLARSLRKRLAQRNREEQRTQISINGQPRIHVYGHFLQTNGLAETARSTVRALQQLGYPCRAIHVPDGSGAPELPGSLPLSLPGMDAEIAIIHTRWNELRRCLECHPELERFPKLRIAYWTAAFGDDPPVMGEAASLVEEIWCPSEFSAAAFRRATGRTVRVAWPNADIEQIEKRADRSIGIDLDLRGKCVFLVLADFSADPYRKNPLSALRAYLRAFPTLSSDRRLLLKLSNVERDPDYFQQLLTACSARPDVLTFQPVLPRPKMLGLLHAATALISLHASDSVGLPIAEMLSLGKPVVATAYGGNIEFRSPKDAGRVSYREAAVKGPDPVREGALRVEPLWEEAVPRLQAIYREWRQGDHREMRPDPWINERSFAMYAENLRAVEQLLRPASVELRSRPSCG